MAKRKSQKSGCGGCLSFIILIFVVGGIINLFDGDSSSSKKSNSTTPSSEKVIKHEKTDEEKSEDYIKTLGLNPNDYIKETDYSRIDFRGNLKSVSGNYNNFTVENINQNFANGDKSLKEVIEKFGKPDTIWVNYLNKQYHSDLYWHKSDDDDSDYIHAEWSEPKDEYTVQDLSGVASNSTVGQFQTFIGLDGFEAAE
ncbi:hypothetical protein [Streptococcus pluranimalium]|uniref:hypothetical protein n=1 Tax=Streptococcus pluranimalium TaxID=82348 RepID=UPI003BF8976B